MADAVLGIGEGVTSKTAVAHARRKRGASRWLVLALVVVALAFTLFPFFLTLINAIKSSVDYAANGPLALPAEIDFSAIGKFWVLSDFTAKLFNSILISAAVAIFGAALSLFNAYAIGIGKVRGSRAILVILLLGIMVPQESIVYPLYYMAKLSGLYDTQLSVIIIFAVLQSAFGTYLLSSVLGSFPREILEAAEIDGASRSQQFWRVTLPLLTPVIFFNVVVQTIDAFKAFTPAFIISGGTGGPIDSTLFYTLYLYQEAFAYFRMGYASALAWILVVIIAAFTAFSFLSSRYWVHYDC